MTPSLSDSMVGRSNTDGSNNHTTEPEYESLASQFTSGISGIGNGFTNGINEISNGIHGFTNGINGIGSGLHDIGSGLHGYGLGGIQSGLGGIQSGLHSGINGLSSLTPGRLINSFLHEEDEQERVEHFKYKQDLQRKMTVTSVIGLGFTLMGVPFGISSTLWISLTDGGNVTMLYGWLVVAFFSICVVLSLSEIISKYPTAGGVYHFSAILSNDKYSLISSWMTGWFLLIGNWTYAISIMFAGSQFIVSVFLLKNADYKEDILLVLGVYYTILTFCGLVNFKFSKHLEKINKMCIYWSIYTVLAIDFLLIFFAKRTNSIKEILTNFDNSRSGWPDAMAFMVGLQSSSYTLTGYGMLFSITDEVKNPERNMPKGAISSILLASVTGLIFILPILTILPQLDLLLDTNPEIMPIDLVFKLATESYIVSFLLVLLLIGTVLFQAIGSLTTASRSTYAFARDGGLPFKKYWIEVDSVAESRIPKNALFFSMTVCGLLCLLSFVSESAFSAFLGASVISLALANGIPILCLMLNKRRKIKGAAFRLRKFGWIVNSLSVFWVMILFVILCLPPVIKNLTWGNMNYAIAVVLGFVSFASVGYRIWGFESFHGPQIDTEYFELNNLETVGLFNTDDTFTVDDDVSDGAKGDGSDGANDDFDDGETDYIFQGSSSEGTANRNEPTKGTGYAELPEYEAQDGLEATDKTLSYKSTSYKSLSPPNSQPDNQTLLSHSPSHSPSPSHSSSHSPSLSHSPSPSQTRLKLSSEDENEISTESDSDILFDASRY